MQGSRALRVFRFAATGVVCAALLCAVRADDSPSGMRDVPAVPSPVAASPPDGADLAVDLPAAAVADVPAGVAAELQRLQEEIDGLKRAAKKAVEKKAVDKQPASASQTDERKPSFTLTGQVQGDQILFSQDPASRAAVGDLQDGAQFRRLRIGARGTAWRQLEYSLGVDFALANQPSFLDNYVQARELPWVQNVRFGHFFEPFSLERVTQNRNNTFMERSLVDTFAPARNMGAMAFGWAENERATWQIGTFRTNSDNIGNDSFESGQALTMRGTWLPFFDEAGGGRRYLHLGAAYSYRDAAQNQVRFRNTPEIRKQQPATIFGPVGPPSPSNYQNGVPSPFAPIFVDTGNIPANDFQLFDPEFALILGPLSLQSEYAFALVDQIRGPNLFFNGYMAQLSWFLTGEHRPYDRQAGVHKRMKVNDEFFRTTPGGATGIGAWEIAARYSTITLNDKNIRGNNLTDFTIGLNWYLNPFTRAKFNYVRAFLEDTRKGNSLTDAYGIRFDYDF